MHEGSDQRVEGHALRPEEVNLAQPMRLYDEANIRTDRSKELNP